MLTQKQAEEILRALCVLPSEKAIEAQDFIFFLKEQYAANKRIDKSDLWTDEDIHDLSVAVLKYGEQTL